MIIHNVEQNTTEWFNLRNKYPLTASVMSAIMVGEKGLNTLIQDKLNEKYFGINKFAGNEHTERGHENEKWTIKDIENRLDVTVEEVGFITNKKICLLSGSSPDGYIKILNAGVEVKNVLNSTYETFLEKEKIKKGSGIKKSYYLQMQSQIAHGNFDSCYFGISNEDGETTILKILPNPKIIKKMKKMLEMAKDKYLIAEKNFIKNNKI